MSDQELAQGWQQLLSSCRNRITELRKTPSELRSAIDTPIRIDTGKPQTNARLQGLLTLLSWAGILLGGLATVITALFTTGLAFQILLGITLVSLAYAVLEIVRNRAAAAPWYLDSVVATGCLLVANDNLFEPGDSLLPGGLLVTFDDQLNNDPEKLSALAQQLKEHGDSDGPTPLELREAVEFIEESVINVPTFTRCRLPRSFTGNDATFVVCLGFDQKAMPNGFLDRDLWPVFGRPDKDEAVVLLKQSD